MEDALRTAALWLSHADALLVLAGEGMAEKTSPWPGRECFGGSHLVYEKPYWDANVAIYGYIRVYRDSISFPYQCSESFWTQYLLEGIQRVQRPFRKGEWQRAPWSHALCSRVRSGKTLEQICMRSTFLEEPQCPSCASEQSLVFKVFLCWSICSRRAEKCPQWLFDISMLIYIQYFFAVFWCVTSVNWQFFPSYQVSMGLLATLLPTLQG